MNKEEKKRRGMPQRCPACRSTRITDYKLEQNGLIYDGWICKACGYQNARRLKKC